eukprot:Rmarinus@m.208
MLIREYRILLPLTVEEYHVAQLYMVAKASEEASEKKGEGIEIKKNEPYSNETGSGQYTEKVIHIAERLPSILRKFAPSSLKAVEYAWNAFPYCKTQYECPLAGDRLTLSVESMHLDDNGTTENPLKLSKEELKMRKIVYIDLATSKPHPPPEENVTTLKLSKGVDRVPLKKGWQETAKPLMCCYKVCRAEFRYWGLQGTVEDLIQKSAFHDIFLSSHRKLIMWMDEWLGLTIEDIRKIEEATKSKTDAKFAQERLQGIDVDGEDQPPIVPMGMSPKPLPAELSPRQ